MKNNGFTAVVSTDFHLTLNEKHGKTNPDGINSRLADKLEGIKKSVDYAIKNKVDYYICLGDVFDKPHPNELLRNLFLEAISPLLGKIPVIILIGNHDIAPGSYSLMSEVTLFEAMNSKDILILNEITPLKLKGIKTLMVPFKKDGEIAEALIENSECVIFGHFGVSGAKASGTEFILSEGIKPSLFDHHEFAFLGHYHRYQYTDSWAYVGSIGKVDFGERNDPKGFFDIKVTEEAIEWDFHDIKDRPFLEYRIYQDDDPDFNALREWGEMDGYVVKLIFVGSKDWYHGFNLGEIRSILIKKLKVHKLYDDHLNTDHKEVNHPEINSSTSWAEGVEVYCSKKDREDMIEMGIELIKKVI